MWNRQGRHGRRGVGNEEDGMWAYIWPRSNSGIWRSGCARGMSGALNLGDPFPNKVMVVKYTLFLSKMGDCP